LENLAKKTQQYQQLIHPSKKYSQKYSVNIEHHYGYSDIPYSQSIHILFLFLLSNQLFIEKLKKKKEYIVPYIEILKMRKAKRILYPRRIRNIGISVMMLDICRIFSRIFFGLAYKLLILLYFFGRIF